MVLQSFTKRLVTDYVYDLPATGKGAKGLLAVLPEGSLIREASAIDLRDGAHHTLAVILVNPRFVPADCATAAGRKTGHRDEGGMHDRPRAENGLDDSLDITELVTKATGAAMIPRFTCLPGDIEPGAIDALVDARFEGRESVRLLDLTGKLAETAIDGLPVTVGIKRDGRRSSCSPSRGHSPFSHKLPGYRIAETGESPLGGSPLRHTADRVPLRQASSYRFSPHAGEGLMEHSSIVASYLRLRRQHRTSEPRSTKASSSRALAGGARRHRPDHALHLAFVIRARWSSEAAACRWTISSTRGASDS